jgi:hypothetical protein
MADFARNYAKWTAMITFGYWYQNLIYETFNTADHSGFCVGYLKVGRQEMIIVEISPLELPQLR